MKITNYLLAACAFAKRLIGGINVIIDEAAENHADAVFSVSVYENTPWRTWLLSFALVLLVTAWTTLNVFALGLCPERFLWFVQNSWTTRILLVMLPLFILTLTYVVHFCRYFRKILIQERRNAMLMRNR